MCLSFFKVVSLVLAVIVVVNEAASIPGGPGKTTKSPAAHKAVQSVPLHLDLDSFALSTNSRPLHNDSISPWTYSETFDPSIYPNPLSQARCVLSGCLNSRGVEDMNLESKPIVHQVLVLRRVDTPESNQTYHYRLESRLLAVGCTCVRPAFVTQ